VDRIFVAGLAVEAVIGVYDHERDAPQPLVLSVWLDCDIDARDELAGTIDYAAVVEALKTFVTQRRDGLLETLAEACVAMLHRRFPKAREIGLHIDKPNAAKHLGCERVGVEIRREFR
jgi:dihydroneopterin aldolase